MTTIAHRIRHIDTFARVFEVAMRLVDANPDMDQIGLNFPKGTEPDDQMFIGCGSLLGTNLHERDFTEWLEGADEIAEVFASMDIGRARLMRVSARKCYSVHRDYTKRIHLPLVTNPQALMIWPEVPYVLHMPADGWLWLTDTIQPHTAMNGSLQDRWHIVGALKS